MKTWKVGFSTAMALAMVCSGAGISQAASDGPITVTMLTHWDATTAKQFQPYIKEYETLHPNVVIQLQTVDFADLLNKISADELAGNGPDIYHIYDLWLPELVQNGAVEPASGVEAKDISANYRKSVVASSSVNGKIYGYPTEIDDYALVYNKSLFKKAKISAAPGTWKQLLSDAHKLTKLDAHGRTLQQGFGTITGWDSGVVHPWLTLLWSNGGQFISKDFKKAELTSPQAKQTLGLYTQMIANKSLNPQMTLSNNSTTGGYQSNFELGRTGMIIMADWWEGGLQATMGSHFKDVGTAPIPVGPSGKHSTSLFYSWMYTVNAHSDNAHQQAAWAFLKWLDDPVQSGKSSRMGNWLMAQGIIPSRTSDQKAHVKELGNAFMKTYVDALSTAQPFPIVMGGAEITSDLQTKIESVEFSKSTGAQALSQANSQISAVLQANYGH